MNPTFWSFRAFAALWGILLAPLAPSLADGADVVEVLPADTLAYLGWTQIYKEDDPDLAQARQFMAQAAGVTFDDPEVGAAAHLITLLGRAAQAPGVIVLLDLAVAEEAPDIQAALLLNAGKDSPEIAAVFSKLLREALPSEPIHDVSVAGITLHSIRIEDTPFRILWGVHGDHFLLTLGPAAAEKILQRLDGAGGPSLADSDELKFLRKKTHATEGEPRFCAFADVRQIVAKARALAEEMSGSLPPMVDKVIEALGVNAVRSKYLHVSDTEYGPTTRIFARLEGERKGILKLWDQQPLSKEDLQIIPRGAYWAQLWNLDLHKLWTDACQTIQEIDPNALPMVEGAVAMAEGFLGFSITEHVLPAFGDTWAVFDARNHGGILLTGSVLVAEVRDADAVHGVLARLVEMARPLLQKKEVNLRLGQTTLSGRTIHYVLVGGVPCPVAPAWTFVDDWMVFGLFPQTVAVAAEQVDPQTRRDSILDHPAVQRAFAEVFPDKIQSFGYTDAEYFARLFYAFKLLGSTVSASMLSVPGVEIDPGVYPVLAEALKDMHFSMGVGATDEDGIHYAQIGASNTPLLAVAVVALLISVLLPSLSRARELAKRAVSASNLRGIGQGVYIYANDHDGKFPDSLDVLIEEGMISREMLNSPRDKEGAVSYVYISGQSENNDVRNVIAYERVIGGEGTSVLFLDGHAEWMKLEKFKEALLKTYQRLDREDELPPELRP